MFAQQLEKVKNQEGFIAALDQSGGSTPKALNLYGITEDNYQNDAEMFALVHAMRTRIITSPHFNGQRVLGAILFADTLQRQIEGMPSAQYLWQKKQIVPFLKVDQGLEETAASVQIMKPITDLNRLLEQAKTQHVLGTKMRSVIKDADKEGIHAVVQQQFTVARQILAAGLIPIIEPEIDIHSPNKAAAERLLQTELLTALNHLAEQQQQVMLKLTLPEVDQHYQACVQHPAVLKVLALSGGYNRIEANNRTRRNPGVIASFSRALTEGLSAQQSETDFNQQLDQTIDSIFQASRT